MQQLTPKQVATFWSNVDVRGPSECWLWKKRVKPYGQFQTGSRTTKTRKLELAHRVAFMLTYGDPGKLEVMHTCDNEPCCNPAHLEKGTHTKNMQDKVSRGRARNQFGEY